MKKDNKLFAKKVSSVALVAALMFGSCAGVPFVSEDININAEITADATELPSYVCSENKDGTLTIVGVNDCASTMTIPAYIDGKKVTVIGAGAFTGKTELTSLTIPNTVTTIDRYTFNYCTNLKTINIPDSVINIGSEAFKYTPWLEEKENAVKTSTHMVYAGKVLYEWVGYMPTMYSISVYPQETKGIAEDAFRNINALKGIILPDTLEYLGSGAFEDCTNLQSVVIPGSVKTIEIETFKGCTSLE